MIFYFCMNKIFRAYYIWPAFPSISITGSACQLNCLHCNKVYLKHMHNANKPEKLIELCRSFKDKGAKGVLISGGCDTKGRLLNLTKFLRAIKQVHEMGLIIKLHTGLVDNEMAHNIANTGVDIASQEIVGDPNTVKEIFDLDIGIEKYFETFKNLNKAGVPYLCPHLCVGLHKGELKGELKALELLKENIMPSSLAIIVFRPTKGTELENLFAPSPNDLAKVVQIARKLFPGTKLILGALRPRSSTRNDPNKLVRTELEKSAFNNGIDGIEIPSNDVLDIAHYRGYRIKKINSYGVLPIEMEKYVDTSWE